ncbi:unnamed protein product [Blepharisma stoltei]|uniref:TPX2 central domain-containing protein n=1 Tax=Blepharisma stoltei TaxID=1481888 RepID=A0AAU9IAC4_9CILI|nr:unnamed protein product [Blepharisma stoltei]
MDIKEIVKTVRVPLISRCGKTLTFSQSHKYGKSKAHHLQKSFSHSDLKKELVRVRTEMRLLEKENSERGEMTSSFKCPSRNQRERVFSSKNEEIPPATKYNPLFTLVKPKVKGGYLGRPKSASPKKQRINLPICLNHELDCKYPIKPAIKSYSIANGMELSEYENLIQKVSRIKKHRTPETQKLHTPEVNFNKQIERKYIPLNLVHESRFELKRDPFPRNSSPNFAKSLERKQSVAKDDFRAYQPKFEAIYKKTTQDIDFSKMSPRLPTFDMKSKNFDYTVSTAITN